MTLASDQWSAGAAYEQFMGRWSRLLAAEFVGWLGAPPGLHWLDVGCGTGSLTRAIAASAAPASIVACDPAEPFVAFACSQSADPRITFRVAGVGDFALRPGGYESITSLLALNFFPDANAAVRRMAGALSANGMLSACVWDYAAGMQALRYFWDAAIEVSPAAVQHDEGRRFPICAPDRLRELFTSADLRSVVCDDIEIATTFASFEDYWSPFLGGTGPAPSFVASLAALERDNLRTELQRRLPSADDGTIALRARAWAVRGEKS